MIEESNESNSETKMEIKLVLSMEVHPCPWECIYVLKYDKLRVYLQAFPETINIENSFFTSNGVLTISCFLQHLHMATIVRLWKERGYSK